MKIVSSSMQLSSQQVSVTQHESHESLRMWVGDRRPDFEGRDPPQGRSIADAVHLSQAACELRPCKQTAASEADVEPIDEPKLAVLIRLVEIMTGKKIRLVSPKQLSEQANAVAQTPAANPNAPAPSEPARAGFGIEYDAYERHYEAEKTTFSADGLIQTADGRQIEFSVDLSMSRTFMREQSVSLRLGDARLKDPLVLNFNGSAAELTTTRYSFDIDSDGQPDQIAFTGPNSGFLALDRNGDGIINDGSELFGPTTGQGFAELAAYDEDGNQWIDENDSIYQNLRIWSKTAEGQDQLIALGQRGVGAIYLGQVSTPFSIKDAENTLMGQVRSSGVFLHENGQAGTIQQIDLVA